MWRWLLACCFQPWGKVSLEGRTRILPRTLAKPFGICKSFIMTDDSVATHVAVCLPDHITHKIAIIVLVQTVPVDLVHVELPRLAVRNCFYSAKLNRQPLGLHWAAEKTASCFYYGML